MIFKTIKKVFSRISITVKMVMITVFCGLVVYMISDKIFTDMVKHTFIAQLNDKLKDQAQEARIDFNHYVIAHYQLVKLFIRQKVFSDYMDQVNWFNGSREDVVSHSQFPWWFPPGSVLRTLANPRIVILFDSRGIAREIYHREQDSLPDELVKPTGLLLEKSSQRNHLTNIDGTPFLIASESIVSPRGQKVTLMLASELDDEFLILSQKDSPKRLLALLSSNSRYIITSNDLELLPSGTQLEKIQSRFLVTGEDDYEYGDSEIVLNLVSFLSKEKAEAMADDFVLRGKQQRAVMTFMIVLLSCMFTVFITRRIRRLTKNISNFSQITLGSKHEPSMSGDELILLENRFHLLTQEIESSQKIIRRESEARAAKKVELELNEGLYKMLQSVTDAIGVGVLTKNNSHLLAANNQMKHFVDICGGADVFKVSDSVEIEKTIKTIHGDKLVFHISSPVLSTGEQVVLVRNITEQKKLENQLFQAQKMEAVGQLAGGVAHDFNNILNAVIGYTELLKDRIYDKTLTGFIEVILSSSNRGVSLIRNLLAFSRKQEISPKPVFINSIVKKAQALLARLIEEDIELQILLSETDIMVYADPVLMEHVLINLATNARDEMPDGGVLTMKTQQISIENGFVSASGQKKSGKYALLSVSDTGPGLKKQVKEKIFEPFFTTKEVGKGSGLGLSMAYGIIKQHGGHIEVYSEPGKGAVFKIYLPVFKAVPNPVASKNNILSGYPRGSETVLLVEDDDDVRNFIQHSLKNHGYSVIEAIDGEDAVNKFMKDPNKIDLLLTDVIMPKKDGLAVYKSIHAIKPAIIALFMSGYTADRMHQKGIFKDGFHFIAKPVTMEKLLCKIRAVLDRKTSI